MSQLDNAYAILIGVGADLPASVRDAQALQRILSDKKLAGYKEENITLLINEDVTRDKVLKSFDDLISKVNEDSSVFLFYSGHGGTFTDNDIIELENSGAKLKPETENESYYYLVPNDFDAGKYRETWVLATELKEKIQALQTRRLILFLDCCHAEGMTKAGPEIKKTELKDRLRSPEGLMHRIDDGQGMSVVSSCRAEELSWIIPEDAENSLFTTCLLEVLQGQHKNSFDEPYIRMTDVINYLMKKVPEIKSIQRPFVNLQMYDDFILSKLPNEKRERLNLPEDSSESVSKSAVNEVVTTFKNDNGTNAVLFVHGFSGEAANTFGNIPEFIKTDPKMQGWDLFPMGYSEGVKPNKGKTIWADVDDINRVVDNLVSAIEHKFKQYKRIALVGHSLGGLVVEQALVSLAETDLERISHVLLFGSPSNGATSETTTKVVYEKLKELHTDSPFIKELRTTWNTKFSDGYPFNFKVIAGTNDTDITVSTSFAPFTENHQITVAGNHFSMVQPDTTDNDSYQLIINTLNDTTFLNVHTNQEEINLLLGEYDSVIKKLLPSVETLNIKGLKQLLFALEGMDRHDEVVTILNNHIQKTENSDLLGMLGGRHKRKYLQNYSQEEGSKALKYYTKGFEVAKAKNNKEQMYYHAINLAFMSLMHDEDRQSMREYAEIAMECAQEDPFESIWKHATLGEASLYMSDFENAKNYYSLAAKGAGIREKISMHTNAFTAYSCLMQVEDDEFIKFLKDSFLN